MKIILVPDDREVVVTPPLKEGDVGQVLDAVDSYELTVSRLVKPDNVEVLPGGTAPVQTQMGHTSLLGIHDHVRALVMSFDSFKVKCGQAMEAASVGHDPQYKLLYQKLADFGLARQRELSIMDQELTKIEKKELERMQKAHDAKVAPDQPQKEPEEKG